MSTYVNTELKQRFIVYFFDDRVWQRVVENEDDWQGKFYDLTTKEEVAAYLAYNIGIMHLHLSDLEGWYDLPDGAVIVVRG